MSLHLPSTGSRELDLLGVLMVLIGVPLIAFGGFCFWMGWCQ